MRLTRCFTWVLYCPEYLLKANGNTVNIYLPLRGEHTAVGTDRNREWTHATREGGSRKISTSHELTVLG